MVQNVDILVSEQDADRQNISGQPVYQLLEHILSSQAIICDFQVFFR